MQNLYKIAVFGISGSQGGAVASALIKTGNYKVIGITRNPNKKELAHLKKQGVEIRQADMNDKYSLTSVLRDVDAVFSVQNFWEAGKDREIEQGKNVVNAAKEVGVKFLLYSSVGGADRKSGLNAWDSKWAIEEYLRTSGLPHCVLRPVYFMDNFKTLLKTEILTKSTVTLPFNPDKPLQMIAVHDIGEFARICFSQPSQWIGKAIELAGDELTMKKAVDVLGRSLGKYVTYHHDTNTEKYGTDTTSMYQWFEKAGYKADIPKLKEMCPGLMTFEKWAREFPLLEQESPI